MSTLHPYFFSESLKSQFAQDIRDAISEARISSLQGAWLQRLVPAVAADETPDDSSRPRVDRLVRDDGVDLGAELTGALLISDPDDDHAPVFLNTLLSGLERFDSRSSLFDALKQRFEEIRPDSIEVDAEHVETLVFETRARLIMRQQADHLENLTKQLHRLPGLQSALGKALSASLLEKIPETQIDVFSHPVQLINAESPANVIGTERFVDVALDEYVSQALPAGLKRQYLDLQGNILSGPQLLSCTQALSQAKAATGAWYEQLLTDYWASTRRDGRTVHAFFVQALEESFRQHLLSGRSDGSLTEGEFARLRRLLPWAGDGAESEPIRVRRLSVSGAGQGPVKLIGLFLIEFDTAAPSGVYLYSSLGGFSRFVDSSRIATHFSTEQGRSDLRFFSSLNDHTLLDVQGPLELHTETITEPFFCVYLDSIIALQKRSLRHVAGLQPIGREQTPVRFDDSIDIRLLVDARLLGLHDLGRWHLGETTFEQIWGTPVAVPAVTFDSSGTWAGKLEQLEKLFKRMSLLRPGVDGCMRNALNRYFVLISGPRLDARTLWLTPGSGNKTSIALLSWALGRVCGHAQAGYADALVMHGDRAPSAYSFEPRLPRALLEEILTCVLPDFAERFERQIVEFYTRQARYLNTCLQPGMGMVLVREYALRLELTMEQHQGNLPGPVIESIKQVLDRPFPGLREPLGDKCMDAQAVSIRYEGLERGIVLPNTFVLCKPQKIEKPVMWRLGSGFKCFDSVQELESWVSLEFIGEDSAHMLNLMSEPDSQLVSEYLSREAKPDIKVTLNRIEGHFIEALQVLEIERQQLTSASFYKRAVERRSDAELFRHLMSNVERDDSNRHVLNHLGTVIQRVIYKTTVPEWINEASASEQIALVDVLQRFYVTCVMQKDFLFDIPSLYEYAQEQLDKKLARDFPHHPVDPDRVVVTLTHYTVPLIPVGEVPQVLPAATELVSQNLVEFSANRFMARQDGSISLTTNNGEPLPASFTAAYVREMVSTLDVAAGYRQLLASTLVKTDPAYAERQKLFAEQVPALDLFRAMSFKLRKELSEDAYLFVEAVLNMPDGIARLPVGNRKVELSPLRLLPASEGWDPTTVINTYLIFPDRADAGPWVLYAPLHGDFVFKEYPDRKALLTDIRTSDSLQEFILDRIDPQMRKVYDNGGFMEPHLPFSVESSFDLPVERPQPVMLDIHAYEGNALQFMFEGTQQSLTLQVRQQSVTNTELRHTATRYVIGLLVEQTMALLPGRLGALVGIWQSRDLLKQSAISAGEQHWGEAFAQLLAGVSMLITSGMGLQSNGAQPGEGSQEASTVATADETLDDKLAKVDDRIEDPQDVPPFPEFSWANNSMTQEVRERLRRFEVRGIALNSLHKDEQFNTYNDPVSGRKYAAIDGKAYELRSDQDGWYIASNEMAGPPVVMDSTQHWKLDLQTGLKGGGGVLTRIKSSQVDRAVDGFIAVDSSGMPDIRRNFRGMAMEIEQGHNQAQRYLENCLDNLRLRLPDESMDPRVQKILADYFATPVSDVRSHEPVRYAVTKLYDALMDPSLSPVDSPRYVVGVNRQGQETCAFIFDWDPQKRIFLTEQFFRTPHYRLKLRAQRAANFDFGAHYRACILIHELSHLVLKTEDVAYIDAQAPYVDLLEETPGYRLRLRNQQIALQQKALSYNTDRSKLFKQMENGMWRDLKRSDGDGKKVILRITGKKTLDEARDVFYSDIEKRISIMLSNADSVALLATLLGRERFRPAGKTPASSNVGASGSNQVVP